MPVGFRGRACWPSRLQRGNRGQFQQDTGLEMAREDRKVWTSGTQGWHLPKGVNQKKPSTEEINAAGAGDPWRGTWEVSEVRAGGPAHTLLFVP